MNLPRLSVRNPVAANLLMWFVVVVGLYHAATLVREMFPNVQPDQVVISVPYPGATPEEIEKGVTRQIERELQDVDDVEEVASRILEGISITTVTMVQGADRQAVLNEVRGEMDKVAPKLPAQTEEPRIELFRPLLPVIGVVLHGKVGEERLHGAATRLRDDLIDMPEISQVVVSGLRKREIWAEIQPEELEKHGLTFGQVGQAVAASNLDLPGGQIKGNLGNVQVRTLGERDRARRLESLIIRSDPDGRLVRLSDLGRVVETFEDRVEKGRFNQEPAVLISVLKTPDQDALKIAARVKHYVKGGAARLGQGLTLDTVTDLSRFIRQRIDLMLRNARIGLILVLISLILFLELRVAFWVAAGLPISFLGTFFLMHLFGATINLISLFALIIVLGLIVDDAIVIAERVFTLRMQGMNRFQAAIRGTNDVALPVLAAVTTTVVAFLPMLFIEGEVGTFMAEMPLVVIAALSVSTLEAFFILPAHLAHLREWHPLRGFPRLQGAMRRLLWLKSGLTERWPQAGLGHLLNLVLRWRYVTLAFFTAIILLAAGLVAGGVIPFVLLSDDEAETVTIDLEMAAGTPEEHTTAMIRKTEILARAQPEVVKVFSVVGTSFSDRGRVTPADPATVGQLTLELTTAESREKKRQRTSKELVSALRQKLVGLAGVSRLKVQSRTGGPIGPDIEIRLRGKRLDDLRPALAYVDGILRRYEGIVDLSDDFKMGKLELRLALKESAAALGLKTRDLAQQLRNALFGFEVQEIQGEDEAIKVRVILPDSARKSPADLARLRVTTPSGNQVPLEEVASFNTSRSLASLSRVDGERALTIKAEVDTARANVNDLTNALQQRLQDIGRLFPGVSLSFEGRRKDTRDALGSLKIGFPIALLAIFAIIAMLFKSYTQPILVMTAIPFALVGAIFGHWIMGSEFTLLSMIGCVALAGIVVNDSLILVDFINRRRREGVPTRAAVIQGARDRLRAILLTTITTCLGLAPLMLATSFQARFLVPMAISLVFGLATATFVTPILLPCLYLIYEDVLALLRWLFEVKPPPPRQAGVP